MNRNLKTSSMTEAAMISGILVIFAYISSVLFSGLMFFYPLPAIILAKRKGLKYSILSLVAADLIISMLLGIQTGISFFILFTPLAIALSYGICKDENPNVTIMMGAASFMISFVIMILFSQLLMGVNYIEQMIQITNESVIMYKDILNNSSANIDASKLGEIIKNVDDMGKAMSDYIGKQFPAILIVSSVIMSAINYFAVSKFGYRFRIDIRKHEGISYFSFPNTFIIAMAALSLLSYLLSVFKINVSVIQMNIFMICFMAMFLQGFAVLKFYLFKLNLNKVARTLILVAVLFMAGMSQMLAILGMMDLILDLRKIRKKVV